MYRKDLHDKVYIRNLRFNIISFKQIIPRIIYYILQTFVATRIFELPLNFLLIE